MNSKICSVSVYLLLASLQSFLIISRKRTTTRIIHNIHLLFYVWPLIWSERLFISISYKWAKLNRLNTSGVLGSKVILGAMEMFRKESIHSKSKFHWNSLCLDIWLRSLILRLYVRIIAGLNIGLLVCAKAAGVGTLFSLWLLFSLANCLLHWAGY